MQRSINHHQHTWSNEEVGGNGEELAPKQHAGVDATWSDRTVDVTEARGRTQMRTEKENGEEVPVLSILELKQKNTSRSRQERL